ncbi:hypothetical protein OAY23_01785 [bacterium]|nr:hypothetical protein [bacterium]
MDKKYTDKFIPLKDDEVNTLVNLKKDSTFEPLKKISEMKKVLDTIKEIYKIKISPRSRRYLNIVSKVRKFQLNAFRGLPEVKKLLDKNVKEKLKSRRGGRGAMRGKAPVDKVISDSSSIKKEDPLGKLLKDIIKSKDTSDLEKAIKDYANIFCQSGIQNLIKTNSIGKVFTDLFTVLKQNVNNLVFQGKIGFDNSGWNASKEFMNILTTGLTCLTQIKPVFDFFKSLFRRAFRVVSAPFRRGQPPSSSSGRGSGPDDDDNGQPPPPPSTFDRQQRNRLNELFNQQQATIVSNIAGASSTPQPQPPPQPQPQPQPPPQPPRGDDLTSGGPGDESGSGAIAITQGIQFGGESEPRRNQFGGGVPSGMPEDTVWDPFNIVATAAYLKTLNTFFNPPQAQPDPTPPMELEPPLPGDDGLGFEDDFERERFEMDEAERARQEAEQEDEEMDRKLPAIEPPESSVTVAGSLFTGGKAILASSFDAVRAAQLASKIFDQMASAVNQVETIDESLELKETIAGQQVIEGDIQQNLIRQMVEPVETNILDEEMAIIEGFATENLEIIQSVQNGTLELDEGIRILQSTVDYINNVLSQIPKDESPEETARLRILRTTILQSIQDLTPRAQAPPPRTGTASGGNVDLSLKQIEDFRAYIAREVKEGRITPQQASEVLSNMLLQKDAEIALSTSARYIKLNKEILDDIDKYNELRGQGLRTLAQRLSDSELGRQISQRPLTVSPILVGLPLPYTDTQQGGTLRPSREPSLDSLYTSSVQVPTRVEIKPYISEEPLPRLTRRAPGAIRRELNQILTEPLRAGPGRKPTEFSRFFGFNEGGPNQVEEAFLRIMRERFGRDGTQLWNEFMTRYNKEESLSVQKKAKLSAEGKRVLIQMIKKSFGI